MLLHSGKGNVGSHSASRTAVHFTYQMYIFITFDPQIASLAVLIALKKVHLADQAVVNVTLGAAAVFAPWKPL